MSYDIFAEYSKTEKAVEEPKKEIATEETQCVSPDASSEEACESDHEENAEDTGNQTVEIDKDFPKKDLGVGGAAFVDEFLRCATDDQMAMLKRGERTLSGFWNWAYSKVKAEYVKCYGSVSGGCFSDVASLASEYFSDAVKEGTVVECEKYKVKTPSCPSPSVKTESKPAKRKSAKKAKKAVVEVAKIAAEDAKKESEKPVFEEEREKEIARIKERIAAISGETSDEVKNPPKKSSSSRLSWLFKD